jgi:O-antigen/teichoic acid export membrane protein
MKKWVFWLVILLLLGYGVAQYKLKGVNEKPLEEDNQATFYFSAVSVPLILVLSLGLVMLLNKNIYLRKWLRTAYVLPLVVPVASIILIWQMLFDWNGSLNAWLSVLQSQADCINGLHLFFSNPKLLQKPEQTGGTRISPQPS